MAWDFAGTSTLAPDEAAQEHFEKGLGVASGELPSVLGYAEVTGVYV